MLIPLIASRTLVLAAVGVNVWVDEPRRIIVCCDRISPLVKVFRCGSRRNVAHWRGHDPRWKTSQGGSRGGLGSIYGESLQSVGATVASGVRLKVRMVPDTLAHSGEDADKAVCFGVIAASCDAGNEQAHDVRTRSADCSWWFSVTNDRRFVMRPAPLVVRATSVFARAGRSR